MDVESSVPVPNPGMQYISGWPDVAINICIQCDNADFLGQMGWLRPDVAIDICIQCDNADILGQVGRLRPDVAIDICIQCDNADILGQMGRLKQFQNLEDGGPGATMICKPN
ncbi:uncharacterized protein LOC144688539 [Cetorhinus maximus]